MNVEKMKITLRKTLGDDRYRHTILTTETALKLSETYGCDPEKTEIAGLLHDCAKYLDTDIQLEMLKDTEFEISLAEIPKALHGPCGAILAKTDYRVEDEEILNAIKYHVFGRLDMTLLEKIIFVADAIEPDRDFPKVEKLRKAAHKELNLAVLMSLEETKRKVEEENGIWYEGSAEVLAYYEERVVLRPGSKYIVDIINMTHEGRGVARIDDFVIFVDGAITGERLEIQILHKAKKYAIAKISKIIDAAEERVEHFCKVYGVCGGCSLQHLRYDIQLKFKQNYVMDCLQRIGGLKNIKVSATKGMKFPYKYRNKVQYPVCDGHAGFYKRRSHTIVEHRQCAMQPDEVNEIMNFSKQHLKEYIRHVVFRYATEGVMMILVSRESNPDLDEFIKLVTDKYSILKSIVLNINTRETNKILGDKNIALYGEDKISDKLLGMEFVISPNSFYQINKEQTRALYMTVGKMAKLTGSEIVYDLYCGIGSIGLYLSKKANRVIGVESVESAVKDARANARHNKVKNIRFVKGKAEDVSGELVKKHGKPDVVVIDPPRKGCEPELLKSIMGMKPRKIIYISCNPSTLARDLKILCSGEVYSLGKVQPIDMFPFTSHIETVVQLQLR